MFLHRLVSFTKGVILKKILINLHLVLVAYMGSLLLHYMQDFSFPKRD